MALRRSAVQRIAAAGLAILAALLGYYRIFPCGCLGLTRNAPTTRVIEESPPFCTEIEATDFWRDSSGKQLPINWELDEAEPSAAMFTSRTRYLIRRSTADGYVLGLETEGLAAANVFKIAGRQAVPAVADNWGSLPVLSFSRKNADRDYPLEGPHPFLLSNLASPDGGMLVTRSYDGPGMGGPVPGASIDLLVPKQRTAYLGFHSPGRKEERLGRARFRFCPYWLWIETSAGWHGSEVFTVALSKDARTLLFCDVSKASKQ